MNREVSLLSKARSVLWARTYVRLVFYCSPPFSPCRDFVRGKCDIQAKTPGRVMGAKWNQSSTARKIPCWIHRSPVFLDAIRSSTADAAPCVAIVVIITPLFPFPFPLRRFDRSISARSALHQRLDCCKILQLIPRVKEKTVFCSLLLYNKLSLFFLLFTLRHPHVCRPGWTVQSL